MSLKLLYGLTVDVELHWGLSLNYFLGTKSRPTLQVIPPTTIIGALSYPLAKLKNIPENMGGEASSADMFREMFNGVYYSIIDGALIPYAEISKIWFYKVRDRRAESDAVAFPKLYARTPTRIRLYYVINAVSASRILGMGWRGIIEYASWSITRLGAKESTVSVIDVKTSIVKESKVEDTITTNATVPLHNVESISGEYIVVDVVDWRSTRIGRYSNATMVRIAQPMGTYHTPSMVEVDVRGRVVYEINTPSGVERLVPW